jgi:hypothetical protein
MIAGFQAAPNVNARFKSSLPRVRLVLAYTPFIWDLFVKRLYLISIVHLGQQES